MRDVIDSDHSTPLKPSKEGNRNNTAAQLRSGSFGKPTFDDSDHLYGCFA